MTQPKPVVREFEVRVCITVSNDPFFADKVPETAFLEYLGCQYDGFDLLQTGFLDHFEYFGRIGCVVPADAGKLASAYAEGGVINDAAAVDLLNGDHFAFPVQ